MAKKETTELAIREDTFPALAGATMDPELVRDIGGVGGFKPSDFPRIKVPSGGGTAWELDGMDPTRELEAVVVSMNDQRLYWKRSIEEGGDKVPDCFSPDGETGGGEPGGDCITCPLSQFGSATKGNGQACTQRKLMFLLLPDFAAPIILSAPPTSLTPLRKFFGRMLLGRKLPYFHYTTKFSLEKVEQPNPHAVISPSFGSELDESMKESIDAFIASTIKPMRSRFSTVNVAAKAHDK